MNTQLASLLLFLSATALAAGGETVKWDRFRGPNGSGLDTSAEVPVEWNETNFAWKLPLPGAGHGSPVILGDRLFLLSASPEGADPGAPIAEEPEPGADIVPAKGKGKGKKGKAPASQFRWETLCIDRLKGEILWSRPLGSHSFRGHRFNSAATSTAAADEKQVVFCRGNAEELIVISFTLDGEKMWQKSMGPVSGGHGFGASPILHQGLVVVNNDQEDQKGNLFALRAATGELAWTVPRRGDRISYSVPCVYRDTLVFTNWQHGFTAIAPQTGRVIAEKSVFNTDTNERAISSPIVAGDLVIGTCGFTANPKHCVAMKLDGSEWQEAWRIEKNAPHIPSVIAVGERVYLWDDGGIITCAELATGKTVWKERLAQVEGACFGSPVSDGKHLFSADVSGNIHVIAAGDTFQYLATNRLGEPCKSTPALAGGWMYLRTETALHAIRPGKP